MKSDDASIVCFLCRGVGVLVAAPEESDAEVGVDDGRATTTSLRCVCDEDLRSEQLDQMGQYETRFVLTFVAYHI